jgi:chromosome segregation ATPase
MRKHLHFGIAAAVFLLAPASNFACQQAQSQQASQDGSAQKSDSQAKPSAQTSQPAPAQPDPLVAAARRAREEKKEQAKPGRVFTNDNLPTTGGISAVGETATASAGENKAGASDAPASLESQEKTWREKFAKLRHKLEQDQQELDVMQRELGVLDVQYYNNPVKAMQQDLTRSDINKKTSDIDAKKALVEADKQAISDAEDDLRKAGGDPGWSR